MVNKNLIIMLIDDDEDDRDFFQMALNDLENKVDYIGVENGFDALAMLEKGIIKPNYIFLDLNMPQMNGRECLGKLKENLLLSHIPVIIFSTSSDPRDVKETAQMGAIDFITKPPRTSELTKILTNFIITQTEISNKKINS
jgi:CheY-like chemotaxis protein